VKQNTAILAPAGVVDFTQVVLLLHGDGADNGTVFTDSSTYNRSVAGQVFAKTKVANPKFGVSSIDLPGTASFLKINDATELALATGDFTIEAWVYPTNGSLGADVYIISKAASACPYFIWINSTGHLSALGHQASGAVTAYSIVDAGSFTYNAWSHVALVRSGSTFTLYKNGTSVGTATYAPALNVNAAEVAIGATNPVGGSVFVGQIDEVRISSAAVYTANFTAPTSEFPNFTPSGTAINQLAEYIKADASATVISAAGLKLYSGLATLTDITGSVTPTTDDWQFQNFNDFILGFQVGKTPISWAGTGNFVTITATSGSAPTGGAAVAAFGRVWGVDADNNIIKYSGLLDHLNWGAAGSGSINMRSIWTRGTDQVVGLAAVGATLVVFGKRHIVLFTDGRGSTLGLDPATMYVVDTIEGTGLVARDSVAPVGDGDLLYLSPTGVQSLSRTIQNKNNPLATVDGHVRDYVQSFTAGESVSKIRAVYNADKQFYLLILPQSGRCFCYDTKFPLQDGSLRVTEWNSIAPKCAVFRANNTMLTGQSGFIGLYSGFSDNGASYQFLYTSPNVYLSPEVQNRLKILKRIGSIVFTKSTTNLTYQWGFDFEGFTGQITRAVQGGNVPEYGRAEYGSSGKYDVNDPLAVAGVNFSEYGGGLSLRIVNIPASGAGRWIQIGLTASINGSELAVQELDIYSKIGGME
jgi:hypothetical protein